MCFGGIQNSFISLSNIPERNRSCNLVPICFLISGVISSVKRSYMKGVYILLFIQDNNSRAFVGFVDYYVSPIS